MGGEDQKDLEEAENKFVTFLEKFKGNEIRVSLDKGAERSSVYIDGQDLIDVSYLLFIRTMADPLLYLPRLDSLLGQAARKIAGQKATTKQLRLRFSSLPAHDFFLKRAVPRSLNAGQIIQFIGTVTKTSQRRLFRWRKQMACNKCSKSSPILADYDQFYEFPADIPTTCPSEDCQGILGNEAPPAPEDSRDIQDVKVQEQLRGLSLGSIPQSLWVSLEDELVDSVKPGDDVQVIGVVRRRWHPLGKGSEGRTDIELWLQAVSVEVVNCRDSNWLAAEEAAVEFDNFWKQPGFGDLAGRDAILSFFCPQVYGLHMVKLALAVVLAGGVERVDEGGTKVRGEAHILLVGDPGTAKSQLLRYCTSLCPRSVLTTGVGSSNAGLTVAASRDGGEWHLEAGALVLADGGICCIDEFNSIKESDRTCIHEAMEQQSLSIAKAGMVTKLKTRCKVLAATNPKGQYDVNLSLSLNTAIASPLLSRFDIVLTMLDSHSGSWDKVVSSHLLEGRPLAPTTGPECWSTEKLRGYFAHIQTLKPDLSAAASQVLSAYYRQQRMTDGSEQARTTVRLLQSCVRIAQGHARLMCRKEVSLQDAVVAVLLLESSTASSASLVHVANPLHTTFPEDPVAEYKGTAKKVLEGLGLAFLWPEEARRLEQVTVRLKKNITAGEGQEALPTQRVASDYTQAVNRIQQSQAPPLPQVEVHQRRKKRRLGLRAGTKPRDESEKELKSNSGINDIEVIPNDHASHGSGDCNDIASGDVEQVGVASLLATDIPFTDVAGDKEHLLSDGRKLTKIKKKLPNEESLSDQLLQENRAGNKQCLEKSLEEEHHHQPLPKVKRIEDSRRVPARDVTQANVGEEKGKPALSSITRKKLSEFRAPGFSGHGVERGEEVLNLNTNRTDENLDTSSTSQLKKKHGGSNEKILKKGLKKSSSENLLKSVTKMKFDLPKLNLDSIGDPFKQDDLEDLDI